MVDVSKFASLEASIGYRFQNTALLMQALTHSSFANEVTGGHCEDYERLEFLGDSVLQVVSSELIFRTHPEMKEGKMSKLRAGLVCERALHECASRIRLNEYVRVGRGEEKSGGANKPSILADIMEAIAGAIFLDAGMEEAKRYVLNHILYDVENRSLFLDAKSALQERFQAIGKTIRYVEVGEEGPEHCKQFLYEVYAEEVLLGTGRGQSKKDAQQDAAYHALMDLKNEKGKTL